MDAVFYAVFQFVCDLKTIDTLRMVNKSSLTAYKRLENEFMDEPIYVGYNGRTRIFMCPAKNNNLDSSLLSIKGERGSYCPILNRHFGFLTTRRNLERTQPEREYQNSKFHLFAMNDLHDPNFIYPWMPHT